MPSKITRTTKATNVATTVTIDAALDAVRAVSDTTSMEEECFIRLSGLFGAIKQLSDEHSTVHSLAGIGEYLADEWLDLSMSERDNLKESWNSLLAIKAEGGAA